MVSSIFGTDGVRGKVGVDPMIPSSLVKIGYYFAKEMFGNESGVIVIGNDGRESAKMIMDNLSKGISHQGSKIINTGIASTPSLAIYLKNSRENLISGIQITASHNLYQDNGMKFFNNKGLKISESQENNINNLFYKHDEITLNNVEVSYQSSNCVQKEYLKFINEYISKNLPIIKESNKELNLIFDCANGALSKFIHQIRNNLPVRSEVINDRPNGTNINDNCGSSDLSGLSKLIDKKNHENDRCIEFGVSFDGDGDRVIFLDENSKIINGDHVVYLLYKHLSTQSSQSNNVVGTIMTNYGIRQLYSKDKINFYEAEVGDKNVLNIMKKKDALVGGESSGHVIINNYDNYLFGDGLITFLHILEMLITNNARLSDYQKILTDMPSKLINIKVKNKNSFLDDQNNKNLIKTLEEMINNKGRILVRKSGTEDVIRVLIEHIDEKQVSYLLDYFCDNMSKH